MKRIGIAALKARLSEHLRAVRRGETLTVVDRDTPIARIVPIDQASDRLVVHRGRGHLADVVLPPPPKRRTDIVALLLEDRQGGR